MRIPVAQATQLGRLNVGTIRQLQCIHLLAFAPKQKINTNRWYLFPVGRKSSLCMPFFPVSMSCANCSNYECTRGFGERKYKSCYILTLFFYNTTVDTWGEGSYQTKRMGVLVVPCRGYNSGFGSS